MATFGRKVVYTPDSPIAEKVVPVVIRCTATVRGLGRSALRGTVVTLAAEEGFDVLSFDAAAPQLNIIESSGGTSLFAAHEGVFRYDTIEYEWKLLPVTAGRLTVDDMQSAVWEPPSPRPSSMCLSGTCKVTVTGTGMMARADTMDTNEVAFEFEV